MQRKSFKLVPSFICFGVIGLVCFLRVLPHWLPNFDLFQRLEWMTYDWRVRQAFSQSDEGPTPLGAVFIDEESLEFIKTNRSLGFSFPFPRKLHGRLVGNLKAQGAKAVGFDVLFSELHAPTPATDTKLADGTTLNSDEYLAYQLRRASNVVLAIFGEQYGQAWRAVPPASLFRTNAWALAHVTSDFDSDGVLRRAKAFQDDPVLGRVWHLGIVLAARELEVDLGNAVVSPDQILLKGNKVERIIPVDSEGFFYINWSLAWNDSRLTKGSFAEVAGLKPTAGELPEWRGKLVVVGSVAEGNNVRDLGTTSLDKATYLVSKHWNVAWSVINNRFVRTPPRWLEYELIVILGIASALLTWNLRPPWPTILVVASAVGYVFLALWLFVAYRYWLPVILPVLGALVLNHVSLVTYQVLTEQREKRRVKSVFAKVVSPNVVNELLDAESINLGGTRREITVMFADVRGFTEFTDQAQAMAEAYVSQHNLQDDVAEEYFNEQAHVTLEAVNTYLSLVADQVKKHDGTLDKYIGDCVMAFWGAPTPSPQHAAKCVQAAIAAQRAIDALNRQRETENQNRERLNAERIAHGLTPLISLPILVLGTGINTGTAIVGLMGSDTHGLNYTVFGREVNLASRLEHESGRSRILIGESTYRHLERWAPELAATCVELPPVTVKGIRTAIKVYEVPWKPANKNGTWDTAQVRPG